MTNLCPECRRVPEYTSFCTLCAQLFRAKSRGWILRNGKSAKEIAEQLGCDLGTVYKRRRELGLPTFVWGRKRRSAP